MPLRLQQILDMLKNLLTDLGLLDDIQDIRQGSRIRRIVLELFQHPRIVERLAAALKAAMSASGPQISK